MQNQILQDVLYTTQKIVDTTVECPIDREILLADYDRRIFKIIKTKSDHTVTRKYINGNSLVIEGYFKVNIFYRPPAGQIFTVISKKIPFSKQVDLTDIPDTPFFINVRGNEQYINSRATNPARVEIKGVYNLDVKVYKSEEIPFSTAVNSADVCADCEEIQYYRLKVQGTKQFSAESEVTFPSKPEKILNITGKSSNLNITAYEDRAVVKGEITAEISYIGENRQEVQHFTKAFLFNQPVDMPGLKENNICYGDLNIINFTITENPQSKEINCIVSAAADVFGFTKGEAVAVCDAFSKKYDYRKEKNQLVYDSNIIALNRNISISLEDAVIPGYRPVYVISHITSPQLGETDNGCSFKGRLTVSVIMKNPRNEYECFTKSEDVYFKAEKEIGTSAEYIIKATVKEASATVTDDRMSVKADVVLTGFVICKTNTDTVSQFTENKEKPYDDNKDEMILYYRDKGEKIFDIATKYRVDTAAVLAENNLSNKVVEDKKMLFIPVYGM